MSVARRGGAPDHLERGQAAAGEDQLVGEAARALLDLVRAVVDRDRLEQHQPVRLEQLGAAREEGVEVLPADRLDHLDRDELRVAPAQVAVVLEQHLDAVVEPRLAHALGGHRVLLARQRRGGDAAAVLAGGVQRQRAPAGADLEQVVVRRRARACGRRRSSFASCASRSVVSGVVPHAAGVGHRLVEEEREQVVAEVVVGGDVPRAPRRACCAAPGVRALRSGATGARSRSSRGISRAPMRTRVTRSSQSHAPVGVATRRGRGCRGASARQNEGSCTRDRSPASSASAGPKRAPRAWTPRSRSARARRRPSRADMQVPRDHRAGWGW